MARDMSLRCKKCYMYHEHCICECIVPQMLSTKVIIVVSRREEKAATNTGRLAHMALTNSAIVARGVLDQPYDLNEFLMPKRPAYLLYPSDDAAVIDEAFVASLSHPINLVVPDGNWRQTVKMCRRDRVMQRLPRIKLPPGPGTRYHVRTERKEGGMATIEAIARVIGMIESKKAQADLERLMDAMVDRTMLRRRGERKNMG